MKCCDIGFIGGIKHCSSLIWWFNNNMCLIWHKVSHRWSVDGQSIWFTSFSHSSSHTLSLHALWMTAWSWKQHLPSLFAVTLQTDWRHMRSCVVFLENTAKTKTDSRLVCSFCTCGRGNTPPYYQLVLFCIRRSKREMARLRTAANMQTVVVTNQRFHTNLANIATSKREYVWKKVANGTGEETEAWEKKKRRNCTKWVKSWILQWEAQRPFPCCFCFSSHALIHSAERPITAADSTCSVGRKAADMGQLVSTVWTHSTN